MEEIVANKVVFPVWKTITIGGKPKKQLLNEMEEKDLPVSALAEELINEDAFTTLEKPVKIQLIRRKVRDLGFVQEPTTDELFTRIKEKRNLCPAEVALHLRLAFKGQGLRNYCFYIAIEPIIDSAGRPCVFQIERYGGGAQPKRYGVSKHSVGGHVTDYRWHLDEIIIFLGKVIV